MAGNPNLVRVRWMTAGACAAGVITTAGIAGGLALAADTSPTPAATTTSTTYGSGVESGSSSSSSDDSAPGWAGTPPIQSGGTSSHANTGAS